MAARDIADAHLALRACERVQHRHHPVHAHLLTYFLDGLIVFLRGDEWQELVGGGGSVSGRNRPGCFVQGDDYGLGVLGYGLVRDVLQRSVYHVGFLETEEVAHAAANAALEYEHVPLPLQAGARGKVRLENGAHLIGSQVDGGSVQVRSNLEVVKGVLLHQIHVRAPAEEGTELLEKVVYGIPSAGAGLSLVREGLEEFRVFFIYKVFFFSELPEVDQEVGVKEAKIRVAGVGAVCTAFLPEKEAQYQAPEDLILQDSAVRKLMYMQEFVKCRVKCIVAPVSKVFFKGVAQPSGANPGGQAVVDELTGKMLPERGYGVVDAFPIQFFRAFGGVEKFKFAVPGGGKDNYVCAACLVR